MCVPFKQRDARTRRRMIFGNFSLAAALTLRICIGHDSNPNHAWLQAIFGLLLGISIGVNLMALRQCRRTREI